MATDKEGLTAGKVGVFFALISIVLLGTLLDVLGYADVLRQPWVKIVIDTVVVLVIILVWVACGFECG